MSIPIVLINENSSRFKSSTTILKRDNLAKTSSSHVSPS